VLGDSRDYDHETGFDKVLVDVECTHEGSIKHLIKWVNKWNDSKKDNKIKTKSTNKNNKNADNDNTGWTVQEFKNKFLDKERLSNICEL